MRTLDRIFGWLMIAGALLHCAGSFPDYHDQPLILLWSLGTGAAELLLGAMNLVRAERRHDLVLARLCVAGNIFWMAMVAAVAAITKQFHHPILLAQFLIAAVLFGMSLRARRRSRPM